MFADDCFSKRCFLHVLVQEDASKGRLVESAAALAVMEDAGQVAADMKISSMVP